MYAVNFPFLKSVKFEELDCPNNEKLNCHIKQEFYLYLNCYKWRRMDFIYQGCPEDNKKPYCIFKLKKRILHIQANAEVIKNFREIMKHFENIPAELI